MKCSIAPSTCRSRACASWSRPIRRIRCTSRPYGVSATCSCRTARHEPGVPPRGPRLRYGLGAKRQGSPMNFVPRTLLWRSFLLISLLMVISVVAWFQILRSYEREPRARQLAQMVVSVVNLTHAALVTAKADKRRELLAELSEREGIRVYPAEPGDKPAASPDTPFVRMLHAEIRR